MDKEQIKREVREKYIKKIEEFCKNKICEDCIYKDEYYCTELFLINIIASKQSAIDEVIKEIENSNPMKNKLQIASYENGYDAACRKIIQIIKDKLKEK